MKHFQTVTQPRLRETLKTGGCGECQSSCQSACKNQLHGSQPKLCEEGTGAYRWTRRENKPQGQPVN